jgi:CTP:molybdopterin cytidylyltransferase MocA
MRVAAVVLAAGHSRRMGVAKAWLEFDGESLLHRVTRVARAAGADPVVVVTGAEQHHSGASENPTLDAGAGRPRSGVLATEGEPVGVLVSRQAVAERLAGEVETVVGVPNGHPIDSLRAGLARVDRGCAVLLWPVDHPFADIDLVTALIAALGEEVERVVVPETERGWGHPVLFGPALVAELTSPLADGGAHAVVHRLPHRVARVPALDPRIAAELNTPEQAACLGIRLGSR